jgi:hypothetical protein
MHLEHFNRGRSFDAEAHYDYDDFIKNGGGYLTIIDVVDADKSKRHIAGTSWTDRVQVTAKQCEEAYGDLLNGEYRRRCNQ